MTKAAFLDRDGTINVDKGYVHKIREIEFIPGIFRICRQLKDSGYQLVVVTNQSGIGRGIYSTDHFHTLMDWMSNRFKAEKVPLTKIYFCPHHPTEGVGEYKKTCQCRKPQPGMIQQARRELHLDLKKSLLIGDCLTDIQAGQAAGVGRNYLIGDRNRAQFDALSNNFQRFSDLIGLNQFLSCC